MGLVKWLLGEEPNPISQFLNYQNKGQFGEYLTEYALTNNNIFGYGKVLCNLYIPMAYGKTTEIDVIMVHEKGIFVFESKNYSGWIFGSLEQKNWTQCLPNKEKNKFYNPIMQNRTHINALSRFLKIEKDKFYSFIIFSNRCELKKVPENNEEFELLKRNDLVKRTNNAASDKVTIFTHEQVDEIVAKLKPLTEVSEEVKQKHIKDIQKRTNKYSK